MRAPLWAPWRMDYILAKKDRNHCVFCHAAAVEKAALRDHLVLLATEHATVLLNRYPFAAGHLLVVPREHVAKLEQLSDASYDALFRLVREAQKRLGAAVGTEAFNIGLNLGEAAGAGIAEHLHVHIVPRWAGDTNFMPVIADVRVMPQYLDETFERLSPHFADLPGDRAPSR